MVVREVSAENGYTGGNVVKPCHYIPRCRRVGGITVGFSYAALSNMMIYDQIDQSNGGQ